MNAYMLQMWLMSNLNGNSGRSFIAAQRFQAAKSACWNATWEEYNSKFSVNKSRKSENMSWVENKIFKAFFQ